MKKIYHYTVVFLITIFVSCEAEKKETPPNIIYILMDDLGYGDVQPFNSESKIKTPHLSQLAQDGMIFTDAHTSSSVCTPTRYGIMTGRYNWRSGLKSWVLGGSSQALIPKERSTVANVLKNNNYTTGFIGKWHLGWNWSTKDTAYRTDDSLIKRIDYDHIDFTKKISHSPNDLGFDYAFGHSGSLDMPPYVYVENEITTDKVDSIGSSPSINNWNRDGPIADNFIFDEVTPHFFEKAADFISESSKKNKPFFLYLPIPAPHAPIVPTSEWVGKSGLNLYADFVMQMDHHVGELVSKIDELGITENTMIVFTSDNGCWWIADFDFLESKGHSPSGIFRGEKADIFEGGHRVPFIVKWPKKIKKGSVSDETICTTDFYATCADIVAMKMQDNEGEDSFSMVPLFDQSTAQNFKRENTIHHSGQGYFSIRKDNYKFIFFKGGGGYGNREVKNLDELPKFQLYDLEKDPAETNNLYGQYPDLEKELIATFKNVVSNGRSTVGKVQKNMTTSTIGSKRSWNPLAVFDPER